MKSFLTICLTVQALYLADSFARTYDCEDKSMETKIEVHIEDTTINKTPVTTYSKTVFKENGELLSKDTGFTSYKEDFRIGKLVSETYIFANGDSLKFSAASADIVLIQKIRSGASVAECSVK